MRPSLHPFKRVFPLAEMRAEPAPGAGAVVVPQRALRLRLWSSLHPHQRRLGGGRRRGKRGYGVSGHAYRRHDLYRGGGVHYTDGTAKAGTDYTAQTGTVVLPLGETARRFASLSSAIPFVQGDGTFSVQLTGVVNTYGPAITLAPRQDFVTGADPQLWRSAISMATACPTWPRQLGPTPSRCC